MSQSARSASVSDWPRFGVSAVAPEANTSAAATPSRLLRIDMFHLALVVDRPAGDDIHVSHRERGDGEVGPGLTALGGDLRACGLRIAGFIPGTALQHDRLAVPAPRHAEAGERLAQHRLLQRGLRPALAAIGRDHHARDTAVAGIGEARDLIETRALERVPRRRMSHERLDLLREVKLP